jgi:hypothetical protein
MGATAAAAVIIHREKDLVAHFQSARALDPASAMAPAHQRLGQRIAWRRLVRRGVIREAAPGKFYLDEAAWISLSHSRRRMATVLMVVMLIGFLAYLLMPH